LAEFRPPVLKWSDADADDREGLFRSVREARAQLDDPDTLVVVGHGRAAIAAASLAIHQRRLGIALDHVECIDPDWSAADPLSGQVIERPNRPDVKLVE
jgi:hypothetical protein